MHVTGACARCQPRSAMSTSTAGSRKMQLQNGACRDGQHCDLWVGGASDDLWRDDVIHELRQAGLTSSIQGVMPVYGSQPGPCQHPTCRHHGMCRAGDANHVLSCAFPRRESLLCSCSCLVSQSPTGSMCQSCTRLQTSQWNHQSWALPAGVMIQIADGQAAAAAVAALHAWLAAAPPARRAPASPASPRSRHSVHEGPTPALPPFASRTLWIGQVVLPCCFRSSAEYRA